MKQTMMELIVDNSVEDIEGSVVLLVDDKMLTFTGSRIELIKIDNMRSEPKSIFNSFIPVLEDFTLIPIPEYLIDYFDLYDYINDTVVSELDYEDLDYEDMDVSVANLFMEEY